ncbi:MAG: bifunctional UDP-sugar hydrolase/5'-nucleotidase [bacterium]
MNRQFRKCCLIVLILVLSFPTTVYGMGFSSESPASYTRLTVIHINDIQGHFTPSKATWLDTRPAPPVGGMASFATYLERERNEAIHQNRKLLVLDAGDWFTGTPESDLTEGKAMIEALNQVEIDFTTIGNHEFDVGVPTLIKRVGNLEHPVLAGNIRHRYDSTPFPGTSDTAIVQKGSVKVGIFGLITDKMDELTTSESVKGAVFLDHEKRARQLVTSLKNNGAQFIIGLTHLGLKSDKKLAREVDGIDLIVGGHTHTRVEPPKQVNGTVITQAGDNLTAVGRLDLDLHSESGRLMRYRGGLITLYHDRYPPDKDVKQTLQPYVDRVNEKLGDVIGKTTARIEKSSTKSSPLGNLITDAMREKSGAQLAFQNPYGIRAELPKGPIQLRKLYEVLPFGNELVKMELTGKQLRKLFEQSASLEKGLLQFSGGTVKMDTSATVGNRVQSIRVQNNPLNKDETYTIVTNSFLAGGGDKFTVFKHGANKRTMSGVTIRKALAEWFRNNSSVEPPVERRYKVIPSAVNQKQ